VKRTEVDLLASHGQTIWHAPQHQHQQANFPHHATLQIGDGDHLAALTGIITVADFRQKHVAHGHEGAPLAGYADKLLFSHPTEYRLLLNLGGIANFTYLPALFNQAYLQAAQQRTKTVSISPVDLLATLVELSAVGVALAASSCVPQEAETHVFVSGGGSHNATLLKALQRHLPQVRFALIDALGISTDAKEAVLFAVLANETIAGTPALSLGKICLP
jgi:1,6-anhydro-N-acetylmuramate kinase